MSYIMNPWTKKGAKEKQHLPGDSKWPFDSLVRGHLTFPNGHLTIPKRAQRIARLLESLKTKNNHASSAKAYSTFTQLHQYQW